MDNNPMEEPETPPVFIFPVPPAGTTPARPLSYWLRKFFACNPFYLVSAAMLLYGVYLVSFDANFAGRELAQLAFNFTSLQVYELLLVGTAIVLARRRIWYDSLLLVALENLLVLVPFILISQAALLSQTAPLSRRIVLAICVAGGAAALLRFWSLKHFFRELNLPRRALVCGLLLLVVNVVLPLVYRHLHDFKVGTKPTDGAAYELNRCTWLLLVPAMLALVNFVPRAAQSGNLLPQRRWLPLGLFALWLAGSVTHVYCLSYVYNFDWENIFLLPLLLVGAWTAYLRHGDFFVVPHPRLQKILLAPPLAVALLALLTTGEHTLFLAFTGLNLACYLALFLKDRRNFAALHLFLLSGATLLPGLVKPGGPVQIDAINPLSPGKWLLLCAAAYGLYWAIRSRNPKAGVWGGLILAGAVQCLVPRPELGFEFGVQAALVFLLTHSLAWVDVEHKGARAARILASVLWFSHALLIVLVRAPHANGLVYGVGGWILAGSFAARLFAGRWRAMVALMTSVLVLLIAPGQYAAGKLETTPAGILVIAGSFLLFALGTVAALTKPRWCHLPYTAPASIEAETST